MNQQNSTHSGGANRDNQQKPGSGASAGNPRQDAASQTVATQAAERAKDAAKTLGDRARSVVGDENLERAKNMASNLGDKARAVASDENIERAKDMARNLGEQARAMVGDENVNRAREMVDRNLHENPYATLLIAGAIGYGIAYLVHSRG